MDSATAPGILSAEIYPHVMLSKPHSRPERSDSLGLILTSRQIYREAIPYVDYWTHLKMEIQPYDWRKHHEKDALHVWMEKRDVQVTTLVLKFSVRVDLGDFFGMVFVEQLRRFDRFLCVEIQCVDTRLGMVEWESFVQGLQESLGGIVSLCVRIDRRGWTWALDKQGSLRFFDGGYVNRSESEVEGEEEQEETHRSRTGKVYRLLQGACSRNGRSGK